MALPSAQLGQLASLNVPSYIPVVPVEKRPKVWQQALLSVLSGAATNALSQGVSNSMARDYADPTQGEKPATGWNAFWKGPTVSEKQQLQRVSEKSANDRLKATIAGEIGLKELGDQVSGRDVFTAGQANLAASDQRQMDMQRLIAQGRLSNAEQGHADVRAMGQEAAAMDRLNKTQSFEKGQQAAVIAHLRGQTEAQNTQNELMRKALGSNVDPKTLTPRQQAVQDRVAVRENQDNNRVLSQAASPAPVDLLTKLLQGGLTAEQAQGAMQEDRYMGPSRFDPASQEPSPQEVMKQYVQDLIDKQNEASSVNIPFSLY